jgi:MFS family permease
MAVAGVVAGVIWACLFLCTNRYLAFGLFGLASVAGTLVNAPLFATVQTLVPAQMRAVSIAIFYLFANLIGMGLGPLAAGALSDSFRSWAAGDSLRYALLTLCPGYLWGAWHVWQASKTVKRDCMAASEDVATVHRGDR